MLLYLLLTLPLFAQDPAGEAPPGDDLRGEGGVPPGDTLTPVAPGEGPTPINPAAGEKPAPAGGGERPVDGGEGGQPVDPAAGDAPLAGGGGRPFLLVISDPEGLLGGEPQVTLCEEGTSVAVLDEGNPPDVAAGDNTWAAVAPGCVGDTLMTLSADGDEKWSGDLGLDPTISSPSVRVTVSSSGVDVKLAGDGPDEGADVVPPAEGGVGTLALDAPGSAAPFTASPGSPSPGPTGASSSSSGGSGGAPWWLVAGALVLGVVGGAAAVRFLPGRGGKGGATLVGAAREVRFPEPLPQPRGASQVWVVPDDSARRQVVQALARRLSGRGPVLVAADPASREAHTQALAGLPTVFWLPGERLELDEVPRAASQLAAAGELALVVEGEGALEAPLKGEGADAVVQDLLTDAKVPFAIVVVTPALQLAGAASVTLEATPAGGLSAGGIEVLSPAGGGRLAFRGR